MIRALVFYAGMVLSLMLYGVLVFPLGPFFPFRQRYKVFTSWGGFVIWWCQIVCGLHYRVEGMEHLPDGPAVVLAKHQSAWETMAFPVLFPPQAWVVKRELLKVPFFGWGLSILNAIGLDRGAGRKALNQLIRQGTERLEKGVWVVIFPEGTRIAPGQRGRYNIGGAMLASKTGYPVIPVAHNAGEFWPRRGVRKRPGTITISIGPPIETAGRTAAEINREAEAWIENRVAELSFRDAPVRDNTASEPGTS